MPAYILWVKLLSHVRLFATPWTVAFQAPSSVEFSRQEYWSGLPFPSPGGLPNPGIEPWPPTLQADALPPWTLWDEKPTFSALHAKLENEGEKSVCVYLQFSRSVVSDSLQPHGLQHARLPCPSPTPIDCQTHVHWVGDAIQPSHPLISSPSPPTFNLSQHQGLLQWVRSSHQVAKVLEFQLQHQSFLWIFKTDFF